LEIFIQVPCYNEEDQIRETILDIKESIKNLPKVINDEKINYKILVIDDGSEDKTFLFAKELNVDYIIKHPLNRGLAFAFQTGLINCLKFGADIIINTDADNQYEANDIDKILIPVIKGEADIVIGARPISSHFEFSNSKKFFQKLGSKVVRTLSKTSVIDAPSGFRAISREAASRINIYDNYTYTLESIIQAGLGGLKVISVPIRVNKALRKSRLVKSNFNYIYKSLFTIMRTILIYRATKITLFPCFVLYTSSILIYLRWFLIWLSDSPRSHVPSLVIASVMFFTASQLLAISFNSFLNGINRRLLERLLTDKKKHKNG